MQARHAVVVQYNVHELSVADLYRCSWGSWRVSESAALLRKMLTKYFTSSHLQISRIDKIGIWRAVRGEGSDLGN